MIPVSLRPEPQLGCERKVLAVLVVAEEDKGAIVIVTNVCRTRCKSRSRTRFSVTSRL